MREEDAGEFNEIRKIHLNHKIQKSIYFPTLP